MQWFALLAAPLAWATQLVVGFGVADASCARGSRHWGVPLTAWQIGLAAGAVLVAALAQVTAYMLYRELADVEEDAPGPRGRLHFFSVASLVGNSLFLALIALTAFGALSHLECRQG